MSYILHQTLFTPVQNALRAFLAALKDDCSLLHQRTASIVVDESHTVETWTGKRKNKCKKANMNKAFRSAFGKLSLLRSMCKKDCPLLALTGTADKSTQDTICNELLLKEPTKFFVSPNRPNLRFCVHKVKKDDMLAQLDWLKRLFSSLKGDGTKRIAIATTSLSYVAFDTHITALLPAHLCCNYCAGTCTCISDGCAEPTKPFETLAVKKIFQNHQSRIVSDEDKHLLSESLQELMKGMFAPTMSPFGITSSHGFSQELISDVESNYHCIFTEDDIYHLVPIFSKTHVTKILGIFSEIFDDIDECALICEVAVDQQQTINHLTMLNEFISTTGYLEVDPEFEDLDILSDE
ncbi:ATP-dependent DNA helicase [Paramuricea clavata]|uniref:DNA 3'-5' helicase n=1 Tax=Paramuricea clavata TaxID=317549 RepID=A0A7D9HPZ3_PARCT|nr:ATP-dependent DNA helicase [Paramuricea clavata]